MAHAMSRKAPRSRRGQSLAETAFVIVALVLLSSGIVEFGRAFMIANMVTHAARDGGRYAATMPLNDGGGTTYRDVDGIFSSQAISTVQDYVTDLIGTVMDANGELDSVEVEQDIINTCEPVVTVTVTGTVDFVMLRGLVGDDFDVTRSVTFRDEGRGTPVACAPVP